jgi:hypothetical protein
MDKDLALVLGIVFCLFSLPTIVSSASTGRAPRIAMLIILAGGALVLYALIAKPGGYRIDQLPEVFFGVINRFLP